MMNHVAKDLLRVLMVIAQLGATVVVRKSEYIVRSSLLTQTLGAFLDDAVHATHGRNNPHLVADSHLAVFAAEAHERTPLVGNIENNLFRVILVREQSRKVGLDVVLVHPRTGFLRLTRVTDRKSVLDDVLALGKVFDGYLVACRHIFQHGYLRPVHFDNCSCGLWLNSHNHIVRRIDF